MPSDVESHAPPVRPPPPQDGLLEAILLVGGQGTRLRPLTIGTPKPLLPTAGVPFLAHQLARAAESGVRRIVLATAYRSEMFAEVFGDGSRYGLEIVYAHEAEPLGTGGGIRNAAASLLSGPDDPVVVLNGDVLTDIDMNEVIRFHRERQATATIVLTPVPNPTAYGLVETEKDGRVRRFLEKPKPEEVTSDTINAGIYILEPRVLDYVPEGEPFMFEYGVFPQLLAREEAFFAYVWRGYWRDIGTASSFLQANLDVIAGRVQLLKQAPVERGEKFDATAEIQPPSAVEPSCTLKSGVQIINSVVSRNCFIEERARIENSVLRAGTRIGAGSSVLGAVIGKGCHIGRAVEVGEV
jgi:NDP-sugar pyrophosphorylase family protein